MADLGHVEQLDDPMVDVPCRRTRAPLAHLESESHILGDTHMLKQRVILKDHAKAAFAGINTGDVFAIKGQGATFGKLQPGDGAQQSGFARAGWPQKRDEFSRLDIEVDRVKNQIGAVIFADILNL